MEEKNMRGSKIIKQIMLDEGLKVGEVANKCGMPATTLSTYLYKDTWTVRLLERVLNSMGYELTARKKVD